jgi:hypothetical protein
VETTEIPILSAIGPGTGWNENPADSDFFNESEFAYTLDLDPASGLTFDIDGAPTARHSPFFKIRQWRSLARPTSVTLEGAPLTHGIHYRADVKPLARGYTAENLLWHCTLESAASCDAGNLDVGSIGGTNGVTIVTGKHGNGALINANADVVGAGTAASGDFNDTGGWIEFWYQPDYDYNDGAEHAPGAPSRVGLFLLPEDASERAAVHDSQGGGNTTGIRPTR